MRKRKFNFHIRVFILLVFFFYNGAVRAQEPLFTSTVSSTQILQNSVFEVQFELLNANGNDFRNPAFNEFKVVSGPSLGSSTMIINGKVTRSQSWTYSLLASTPGNYTIGAASVIAGRRKLTTKPITVTVVAAEDISKGNLSPGADGIKLIAYIKPGDYYPGQQIVLEYKLLFSENIQSANTIAEDDYADFFIQNFNSFSKETTYENINGATFASRIIKAIALFPHQSGTYTIDPMVLMVGINAPFPGNQGFFAMRRLHNIQIASEPLTIRVLPLPADQSAEVFSGAVGEYSLRTVQSGSTQITTDDDFSMRIEITGNGDSRRWDPPVVATDSEFEMYEPRIIEDKIMDAEGQVIHSRTIEYVMIPRQAGNYSIHVPFRFFNPESRQYETIHSETTQLTVSQGKNMPRHITPDSAMVPTPRPLKKVSNINTDDRFWLSVPNLLLFGLLLSGTCWGMIVAYKRKQEAAIPASERIRSISSRNARHLLDQLNKSTDQLTDQEFFETVTEVYNKFLSEKFNILPADLDADKIQQHFRIIGIPDTVTERALEFFNRCLSIRYGGIPTGFSREEIINECKQVIDELDSAVNHHI